jgi:cytochrome c-type biogenesis protein CcmH
MSALQRHPRALIVMAIVAVALAVGWSARPQAETASERVDRITSELRCVVCQGLSVKDSPAESARQMRDLVVQRVAEGRTDQQIIDEFRASYGDWVVLTPPLLSWRGLVWLVPLIAVIAGVAIALRRMRSSPQTLPEPPPAELAALRERVAREEALDLPLTEGR